MADGDFQDIILSTPHHRFAGLLHRDLAASLRRTSACRSWSSTRTRTHMPVPNTTELAGPLT